MLAASSGCAVELASCVTCWRLDRAKDSLHSVTCNRMSKDEIHDFLPYFVHFESEQGVNRRNVNSRIARNLAVFAPN